MRGNFGTCQAGTDGLRCAHPGYQYDADARMVLCVDHWQLWLETWWDITHLSGEPRPVRKSKVYDVEQDGGL